jgi:hypothetical protein
MLPAGGPSRNSEPRSEAHVRRTPLRTTTSFWQRDNGLARLLYRRLSVCASGGASPSSTLPLVARPRRCRLAASIAFAADSFCPPAGRGAPTRWGTPVHGRAQPRSAQPQSHRRAHTCAALFMKGVGAGFHRHAARHRAICGQLSSDDARRTQTQFHQLAIPGVWQQSPVERDRCILSTLRLIQDGHCRFGVHRSRRRTHEGMFR